MWCSELQRKLRFIPQVSCVLTTERHALTTKMVEKNVLPPRDGFVIDLSKFFICEKHCPADTQMVTIPGGSTRTVSPPSIFDVPSSCLPSPKPAPRQSTVEDLLNYLKYFLKDNILSFATFRPDKELHKTYKNIIITRTVD